MSEKKNISVKINGKSQSFEEISVKDERSEDECSLDDIHKQLENVIDFTKRKQEREHRQQPFWDDGNHNNIPQLPFHKRKKKRLFSGFKKLPLTVIIASLSAIIIGLGLGLMLLTIFTGGEKEITTSAQPQLEVEAKEVIASVGEEMPVFLIQVGAFSNLAKGKEMVGIIKEKGFTPFLKEESDPKLLFAGIASERGQAEKLQEIIQLAGLESFIKTEQITVTSSEVFSIYEFLMKITERGLTEGKVDAKELASIQVRMNELELEDGEVAKSLLEAVQDLQSYSKKADKEVLWKAQGKLIEVAFLLDR